MATLVVDRDQVIIPPGVSDLKTFRRWAHSDEFPEAGRICFYHGEVWVDMSRENLFTHNQVKGEYNVVLGGLVKKEKRGRYIADGMLLTNTAAELSCQPDGAFVSYESLRAGSVRLIEGVKDGIVELEGSPDMTLEIVSNSSVEKDTVSLRELYWLAGIEEYWLVDVRGGRVDFDMLKRAARGYTAVRKQGGWLKSAVFGKSFRLTRGNDQLGNPEFNLQVR